MDAPLVSVVVPVYNGAEFLAECLGSLLLQDHPAIEVIVVDDGSDDDSAAIAERYEGVRVLRIAHAGLGTARNTGVEAATGPLIGFCDADDTWKANKASAQVEYLRTHPDVDFVLCRQDTVFADGAEHPSWLIPDQAHGDLDGVSPTSALVRREVFDQVRFRTDMDTGTDFNFMVRVRSAGFTTALMHDSLRVRRIHGDNMTDRVGPAFTQMFGTVREHLRRQR